VKKEKREALEAAGWVFEDAEDFLELTPEERYLVDLRLRMGRRIRALRNEQHLTQAQLAKKLKTSQPRVNRIESGAPDVSLDQMISGFIVLGGTLEVEFYDPADLAHERRAQVVGHGGRRVAAKNSKIITKK
jgi:DNA-binding XRE family transcriptional regulator